MLTSMHEQIRLVLADTDLADPVEIAEEIFGRLSPTERMQALREVLPSFVRQSLAFDRRLTPAVTPARELVGAGQTVGGSARVRRIRDDWQTRLQTPLCVDGVWMRLAECTADDLRTVAADLRVRAGKIESKAAWYEQLAGLLPPGGTVGSLSHDPTAEAA